MVYKVYIMNNYSIYLDTSRKRYNRKHTWQRFTLLNYIAKLVCLNDWNSENIPNSKFMQAQHSRSLKSAQKIF